MDDTRGAPSGAAAAGFLGGGGVKWATTELDANGVVARWSEGAEWLLGYPEADIVGRPAGELLLSGLPESARHALADQETWSGTVTARYRDGGSREVGVLACPLRDSDGTTRWLLTAAAPVLSPGPDRAGSGPGRASAVGEGARPVPGDASPEHDAVDPGPRRSRPARDEKAHDETVTEWAFTQQAFPMAIHDLDLRLLRANDVLCRIDGRTEDEMRGEPSGFLTGNRANAQVEAAMRRALRTGEPEHVQTFRQATGEARERAWAVSLSPLKDSDGRVRALAVAALEISEQYWARESLALLNEASMRIGTTLDVTRTAQELAGTPLPHFADFVSVDLLDSVLRGDEPTPGPVSGDVRLRRVAHESAHSNDSPEAAVGIGEVDTYPEFSPPARCLATARAVLTGPWDADYTDWMARDPKRDAKRDDYGVHSLIAAPLVARGNVLGAALFSRRLHLAAFTEDDLLLAEQLATRAAVCIDNARRYTRERGTAVTLQRSLLPRGLPPQSAVEVATRYLPADSQYGVGGDWFDVIPLAGSRVALVVGDVVGHGIHASATMGRLRTAVRTLADIDLPPDELLTHLDDVVIRLASESTDPEAGHDIGASCLYAIYDPVSRRLCAARAGHPPPALTTPDGTVDILDVPAGPTLGLGDLPFECAEFEVQEGSTLVLYTDGLIESRERDVGAGIEELREVLARPSPSLEATCDTVLRTLLSTPRPTDDVALLVARTRALDAGQVATWELPAEPALVGRARDHATAQLAAWGLEELTFTTELVVSELFTNAILHAEGPVQLRLIRDRTLICEVSDTSTTAPHLRRARVFDEGGRGLLLVAQLTQRWGTRQIPTGKAIWAEQALPAA
ncbi:SpoIIE family protein phosphatase [Streptomyces sp. NPDC088116]|uniref:ATP-binding SpoIIE family protein phosphatase n=1 Tax=Streptomyces sp. NPDC088116 TaxID=3365825 RepID=UPI00380A8046